MQTRIAFFSGFFGILVSAANGFFCHLPLKRQKIVWPMGVVVEVFISLGLRFAFVIFLLYIGITKLELMAQWLMIGFVVGQLGLILYNMRKLRDGSGGR